jgi:hypothetical protein
MATYTAIPAGRNKPAKAAGWAGAAMVATGTIDTTAALVGADVYRFCRLPKGAVVVGGRLMSDALVSGTFASQCLTLNIGVDVAVKTALGTSVTTASTSTALGANLAPNSDVVAGTGSGENAIDIPLGGLLLTDGPFRLTDNGIVYMTVVSSGGAGSQVAGTFTVVVDYFMEQHV